MLTRKTSKYGEVKISINDNGYFFIIYQRMYFSVTPDRRYMEYRFGENIHPLDFLFRDFHIYTRQIDDNYNEASGHLLMVRKKAMFYILKCLTLHSIEEDIPLMQLLRKGYETTIRTFYQEHGDKIPYVNKLFKKQFEEIPFLYNIKTSLLAFDQGTGKTITSATVAQLLPGRVLVICPINAKSSWVSDLVKKWGFDPSIIYSIRKNKGLYILDNFKFVVIHYEEAKKYQERLCNYCFDTIVLDEVHNIKNRDSAKSKSVSAIVGAQRERNPESRVMMLSGTPYKNSITDFIAYLKIDNHPMGRVITHFKKNYCAHTGNSKRRIAINKKGASEFYGRMANLMTRVKKEDIAEMKGKIIHNHYIDSEDIWDTYSQALEEIGLEQSDLSREQALKRMLRILALYKVPHCASFVNDDLLPNGKVVVFSMFVEPLEKLHEQFKSNSVLITGQVSQQDRLKRRFMFENDEKTEILFATLQVAGTGIDGLQNVCSQGVFLDLPFTPAEFFQGTDRLDRLGQNNLVLWYILTCVDTLDEVLSNIIQSKKREHDALVEGKSIDVALETSFFETIIKEISKTKKEHEAITI